MDELHLPPLAAAWFIRLILLAGIAAAAVWILRSEGFGGVRLVAAAALSLASSFLVMVGASFIAVNGGVGGGELGLVSAMLVLATVVVLAVLAIARLLRPRPD